MGQYAVPGSTSRIESKMIDVFNTLRVSILRSAKAHSPIVQLFAKPSQKSHV